MACDSACRYTTFSLITDNASILIVDFKVSLLTLGKRERFLFNCSVAKPDHTIIVDNGQSYATAVDDEVKLIAIINGAIIIVSGHHDIED